MQKTIGLMRKAIQEFNMIENGDKIAVGVSGGKDSLVLLEGLCRLKLFMPIKFDIVVLTLDLQFKRKQTDFSEIKKICDKYFVPYVVKLTEIGHIVFDIKKETHPCSLCARMRRGALHDLAILNGCNKIAFGHHFDDVVETFMMNLFNEGRIACFSPKTYLSRKNITLIRPLVLTPEIEIKRAAKRTGLKVLKSSCPVDGTTNRQTVKEFLNQREKLNKGFKDRIFGAMRRAGINGWGFLD
ncbi:MAG: tRNA 2-thiocytidine biosynthesis TtcA family protein [Oscillospiraceae bacterium]|nr:tRNA 2-thiocytidine biosynthesis TtcA family protein [Oscillospiraceae bacterium]